MRQETGGDHQPFLLPLELESKQEEKQLHLSLNRGKKANVFYYS